VHTLQQPQSLTALVDELLTEARSASSHRAARTIYGGQTHDLRQTVIALARDASLGEHESPGEATLQVLAGQVRLQAGDESWSASAGDYLLVPPRRHDLHADTDSVVLLTVATRGTSTT
jgi:quercetin dioxygenase-like cupin family protein